MKLKNISAVLLCAATLSLSSCVNDLEVFPLDENVLSADKAYSDAASYTSALNKIYSVWALSGQDDPGSSDIEGLNAGSTVLLRTWWTLQEESADVTTCSWPNAWNSAVNGLTWTTAEVEPIEGVYQRCMYVVAVANEFLKNIGNAPAEINKAEYTAEARFCRALVYYTLMDLFANPPFITEKNYSLNPSPISRTELFNWIESELKAIESDLPARAEQVGRADQGVVNSLLARMYLNAVTYTGTERYSDCIKACESVIANGYELADNYAELFMADNSENAAANKEIIFPILSDGITSQSYGIGAVILGSRSGATATVEDCGCNIGWDGFRATGNMIRSFEFENDDESTWTSGNILDKRGIFFSEGKSIDIITTSIETFKTEGWSVYKFTNLNSDGTPGKNPSFPDTDFPLFRLADIYLMYAEATARGAEGGDMNKAVAYVNALRERGYGDTTHAIDKAWLTASASIAGSSTSVEFGNILNERCRELYWEGTRRTDLIRYDLYTSSSYVWADKGGIVTGVGVDSHYNLFPIPQSDLGVNGNLVQNPGY